MDIMLAWAWRDTQGTGGRVVGIGSSEKRHRIIFRSMIEEQRYGRNERKFGPYPRSTVCTCGQPMLPVPNSLAVFQTVIQQQAQT